MSSYWAGYFGNFSCWIHVLEFSALSFQVHKRNEIRIVALWFGRHGIDDLWVTASGRLTCRLFGISSLGDRPAPAMRENSQRWHTRANDTYVYLDGVLIPKRRIIPCEILCIPELDERFQLGNAGDGNEESSAEHEYDLYFPPKRQG